MHLTGKFLKTFTFREDCDVAFGDSDVCSLKHNLIMQYEELVCKFSHNQEVVYVFVHTVNNNFLLVGPDDCYLFIYLYLISQHQQYFHIKLM